MSGLAGLEVWLRQAQGLPVPERQRLLLRGSLLLSALVPGARRPADVDYLVSGPFEPDWIVDLTQRVLTGSALVLQDSKVIWGETAFPGVRCFMAAGNAWPDFQVDFAFHDPLSLPAQTLTVAGVPDVLACSTEDLWAWKLHGLIEFGRGRWRGKDLYDLALLSGLPLQADQLRSAAELAFSSRGQRLSDLNDLMTRLGWGLSLSTGRKWRTFQKRSGVQTDLLACREAVKTRIRTVWPAAEWGQHE